jgi:glutamate carboxypeptidase
MATKPDTTAGHSPGPDKIHAWLRERNQETADLALRLTACESPTDDLQAVTAMAELLTAELLPIGLTAFTFAPAAKDQRHLILARPGWQDRDAYQVLVGHLDTVWPLGTLARIPAMQRDGLLFGPGVFDMKAGLAQMVMALAALDGVDCWPNLEPVVFINTDEETGSRESRGHLEAIARGASRALILEPAQGVDGRIKTARMGVGHFQVEVAGRAAHSGLEPGQGVSAIRELAALITDIYRLAKEPDCTVNVGVIRGGTRHNVVAGEASALVELRAVKQADAERMEARLRALTPHDEPTTITVTGAWDRPAMERTTRNRELWHVAQSVARGMGIALDEAAVGGASDGNLTSQIVPTLDGLGAVGGGAHSDDEHVRLDYLAERATLVAEIMITDGKQADEAHDV